MNSVDIIKDRRSINYFDPNYEISDSDINEILNLSKLTPSSLNLQPWEIISVKSKENKIKLRKCAMNQEKVEKASVVFIVIADIDACEKNIDKVLESWVNLGYMDQKTAEIYKNLPLKLYGDRDSIKRKFFALKNASFFAMSIMYFAKILGFESHPMDGFDEEAIKKEFSIDKNKIIPLIIAVGKKDPQAKLLPRAYRKEVSEFNKII